MKYVYKGTKGPEACKAGCGSTKGCDGVATYGVKCWYFKILDENNYEYILTTLATKSWANVLNIYVKEHQPGKFKIIYFFSRMPGFFLKNLIFMV